MTRYHVLTLKLSSIRRSMLQAQSQAVDTQCRHPEVPQALRVSGH
jgi:hypothetical protein